MKKRLVLKYRWIVLFAVVSCGSLAIAISFGTARKGVTPTLAFVPLTMLLVALIPASVSRIVNHGWFAPIFATWACGTIVATHFASVWLMGLGHQCDRVVLTANGTVWLASSAMWAISRLWRLAVTFERRKLGRSIQVAVV